MNFYLNCWPEDYKFSLQEMLNNIFRQAQIEWSEESPCLDKDNYYLKVLVIPKKTGLLVKASLLDSQGQEETLSLFDQEITDYRYKTDDWQRRGKEKARLAVLQLCEKVFSLPPRPWGILLGVRPTKVVHRLMDKGFTAMEITRKLENNYYLQEKKAQLLVDVAAKQRKFLLSPQEAKKKIAIYVGIPFCPTRCLYCSFPAYSLRKENHFLQPFWQALLQETAKIGQFVQENDLVVESVYLGGGTPTSLQAGQLEILLEKLNYYFHADKCAEFTVEAGRPDTINREKLQIMKNMGVGRLSINPQTMNEETLKRIGRCHSVQQVYQSMHLAREIGFSLLNMDLILGLPGEGIAEVKRTMEQIKELSPENLTCHTMALKRASLLRERLGEHPFSTEENVEKMLEIVNEVAQSIGLLPYYLYRQRYILGNLENIGYALPGQECLYNIQMMEERQTVIALGGGSVSKLVYPPQWQVERFFNPKDPKTYFEQIDNLLEKKLASLGLWLTSLGE